MESEAKERGAYCARTIRFCTMPNSPNSPIVVCPRCGSARYDTHIVQFDDRSKHCRVECSDCGAFIKWGVSPPKNRVVREIPYPSDVSLFEVQAFLYGGLKALGYDVRGGTRKLTGEFRLVVYDAERKPLRVVKTAQYVAHDAYRIMQRQYRGGLVVDWIAGIQNARKYVGFVAKNGLPTTSELKPDRSKYRS